MTKRAYVSRFDDESQRDAILQLEADHVLSIQEWLLDIKSKIDHPAGKWWWRILFSEDESACRKLNEKDSDFLRANWRDFAQQLAREKILELSPAADLDHVIVRLFSYFKNFLESKKTEVVLFSDVPHGPYDYILYKTAIYCNIEVLFLMPSFWPDITFIYKNLDEIGGFDRSEGGSYSIKKEYKKFLPYMIKKSTAQRLLSKIKIWSNSDYHREKKEQKKRRYEIYRKYFGKYWILALVRYLTRYREKTLYRENERRYFSSDERGLQKYVYFALHLQPEMTTDTLGGRYYDQCLAIENLSRMLPAGWKIVVKENPKQTYYMRSIWFFRRLSSIPNVVLVSRDVDTYALIERSQFVATITGTVGWEAITGGKPALVFGYAWYRNFPGVTSYREGITVEEVMGQNIDHQQICQDAYSLRSTGYTFVAGVRFADRVPGFDAVENAKRMAAALKSKLIGLGRGAEIH